MIKMKALNGEPTKNTLIRCPFENDTGGKFNGEVPMAEWEKVKKK